ncbi:MAG: class I SAM-dependent DNA methyltransferase [Ardenticatenaceae bacterium]
MSDRGKGILRRVSSLKAGDYSDEIYDEWAGDYDRDLIEEYGYIAPQIAAEAFAEYCPDSNVFIIDYGCGTGLAGEQLKRRGYTNIDGLDISNCMLQEANKNGVYKKLLAGDLTKTINLADGSYDAAICVGAFGNGHVEPEHLPEIIRTIKPEGLIVLYMNGRAYLEDGYAAHFARLEENGTWQIIKTESSNYMNALNRPGRLVVARRQSE